MTAAALFSWLSGRDGMSRRLPIPNRLGRVDR